MGHGPHAAFLQVAHEKVRRITENLQDEGTCVVLTGEQGCGKAYLAQSAAQEFESSARGSVVQMVVNSLDELSDLSGNVPHSNPLQEGERILRLLEVRAGGKDILLVALNIDRYPAEDAAILEHLVRAKQVRLICTAQQFVGAADRLIRHPGVQQATVSPFTFEETGTFLAKLLEVDLVAPDTVTSWHTESAGNQHALVTLALSAERRGILQRARRVAWVTRKDNTIPADFITQLSDISREEQEVLELVAFATPVQEPPLLRMINAQALESLLERQILSIETEPDGSTALTTNLPALGTAIRTHLSPLRRTELAAMCFDALNFDDASLTLSAQSRIRLVRFGVEGGCDVPIDWVWQAMRIASTSEDLNFVLVLALRAMANPDLQRSAEAMLRAADYSYFLGNRDAFETALAAISDLLEDEHKLEQLGVNTRLTLMVVSIHFRYAADGYFEHALAEFDRWETRTIAMGIDASPTFQAARMRVLAINGQVRAALETYNTISSSPDLKGEWITAPARTFEAMLLVQRGEFDRAIALASATRRLVLLRDISPTMSGDMEGFVIFLGHWARGTSQSAKQSIEAFSTARGDLTSIHSVSGLVDLSLAMLALQEGRWYETSDITSRLLKLLATNDPFGIKALTHALHALALAVLGEHEEARECLRLSTSETAGISMVLHGILGNISLRVMHWLRDPDLLNHALQHAAWAREEDLPLVEMKALDVAAHESPEPNLEILARAEEIVGRIDAPIGDALLAHIRALTSADVLTAETEERLLSQLGVWLPLPPAEALTGREREVALFTALGYPSKTIAERLHLSARTVETHLTHVYGKLGISSRDDLRDWFARYRENKLPASS